MWQAMTYLPGRLRQRVGRMLLAGSLFVVMGSALAANPVPVDDASVASGAQLFAQYCTECHGRDGRAQIDVISDATDLTEPEAYYSGASEDDIFNSISNGAGVAMPSWSGQITDRTDIWHLVNFIRSLWTQEQRAAF
jgi:cytochrome c oxidase cbb3-type subunit 3